MTRDPKELIRTIKRLYRASAKNRKIKRRMEHDQDNGNMRHMQKRGNQRV